MNTFELIELTEKWCRGPLGISTSRSCRAAGIILMHAMRNEIIKTGTVFHPECRLMWDHNGRIIQERIQAQMVVEVNRASGTVHFHR